MGTQAVGMRGDLPMIESNQPSRPMRHRVIVDVREEPRLLPGHVRPEVHVDPLQDAADAGLLVGTDSANAGIVPGYSALTTMAFARPVSARDWLDASNPSERWKWDFMFQDLPPVKFEGRVDPSSIPVIRLQKLD